MAAFESHIFEAERIKEADYVLYSPYNSGYYRSRYLRVGPDQRIWTSDIWEKALIWIDADVDHLEQPMPDWIHETLSSPSFEFVANFGGLILLMVALLMIYAPTGLGVRMVAWPCRSGI